MSRDETTETPGIYRRHRKKCLQQGACTCPYWVSWRENGQQTTRTFYTYEDAKRFKHITVEGGRAWKTRQVVPSLAKGAPATGYVYGVQFGDDEQGPIKIGWARDPSKRIVGLSTANPGVPSLRLLIPGPRTLEKALHYRYRHLRVRGEFFSYEILSAFREDLSAVLLGHSGVNKPPGVVRNQTP